VLKNLSLTGDIKMPDLLEYEAKRIFENERIPIPVGNVASTPEEAARVADKIGKPVAVKIQIPSGGRGREGGIKFAYSVHETETLAREFLGKPFLGYLVRKVLVEEKLEIEREMYLGVINDRAAKAPTVLLSSEGGMEVEEITERSPEKLARMNINIIKGLQLFQARNLARKAGVPREIIGEVSSILLRLYKIYRKYDAVYTEINPLCLTKDRRLVAADARICIDDNAMYRHGEIKPETWTQWNEREKIAHEKGFGYVELNTYGEIACIANGAGLGMCVMDYINEATKVGSLACFLDVGGRFYELAGDALKTVLTLPNLKAILIHSYGGVTRQDILAESICRAIEEVKPKIPIFIQLSGTGEKIAIEVMKTKVPMLRDAGITIEWSSHIVTGAEDKSAQRGGVDVIEKPVKRVIEWCGYKYRRNPPNWLRANPNWEELTRTLIKGCLAQRPEPEYQELAKYE
jgi:succinyl-CoA synthetase beta subunit